MAPLGAKHTGGVVDAARGMIWPFGGERAQARQLNRDAHAVVTAAERAYPSAALATIADLTAHSIRESLARASDSGDLRPAIGHFKMLHGEARKSGEQSALTAYTLVIIYLSAMRLESDLGRSALTTIDTFIAKRGP